MARIAVADTIQLVPCKDETLIQTTDPDNQLSNGMGDIYVGRTNQDGHNPLNPPLATISIRRGLMEFNIAAGKDITDNHTIPAGAIITSVSLSVEDVRSLNGDQQISLHDMFRDWGEGSSFFDGGSGAVAVDGDATWLYAFYHGDNSLLNQPWSTPGGAIGTDYSSAVSGVATDQATGAGHLVTWSSAQMVADVQNWLNNPGSDFGWMMLGNESDGQTAKRFVSREGPGLKDPYTPEVPAPLLTIQYTLAAVPEPSAAALIVIFAAGLGAAGYCRRRRLAMCGRPGRPLPG
jgi:hypothetical protein